MIKKWRVVFEDTAYTLYSACRYVEKATYQGRYKQTWGTWAADLYIKQCPEAIADTFRNTFSDPDNFKPETQQKYNEIFPEYETYFGIDFIDTIPKEKLNLNNFTLLLAGVHWDEDKKCLFEV